MSDTSPIPCHICGKTAVWSDVYRRWRCVDDHTTSEFWAAAHFLGPFAPPAKPAPEPRTWTTSVRYPADPLEIVRPDLFP